MTAQPHGDVPRKTPERTPKGIRAALIEEEAKKFDEEYRAAMAKATEELDLTPVTDLLDCWWPTAVLRAHGRYDVVTAEAARVQELAARGEDYGYIPWREALGLEPREPRDQHV